MRRRRQQKSRASFPWEQHGDALATLAAPRSFGVKQIKVDAPQRTFEGLLSTWERDLGDDIVHRGAFKATLEDWRKDESRVIPLLDTHSSMSVRSAVGKLIDAKETAKGLWTKWKVIGGPDGDGILQRIIDGVVNKMSMGYSAVRWEFEKSEDSRFGMIRHLHEVDLDEGSLVLRPMNEGAVIDTDSVKSLVGRLELSPREVKYLCALRELIDARLELQEKRSEEPGEDPDYERSEDDERANPDEDAPPADEPEETHEQDDEKQLQDPAAGAPADDEGPDLTAFNRLRLRRLGYAHTPQAQEA